MSEHPPEAPVAPNLTEDTERLRPRVDVDLGAFGAWLALGIAASLLALLFVRQLWMWW